MTHPLTTTLTITITTRKNGNHYADQHDLARHGNRWILEALEDRDDIEEVIVTAQPPADRAAVLTEGERTMLTYALDQAQERIWSEGGFTDEDQAAVTSLRRLAVEAQQPECSASISGNCLAEVQSETACDTEAGECVHGGRPAAEAPTTTKPEHACGNCEGIDPDTCLMNPNRPPEQCPRSEGDGYGLQCQKPAGHNLCTFEEQPAAGVRQDGAAQ